MPILKPITDVAEAVQNVTAKHLPPTPINQALDEYGASDIDIARVIGSVMNYSEHDSNKLRAAQMAIDIKQLGKKETGNQIVFNLVGQSINLGELLIVRE